VGDQASGRIEDAATRTWCDPDQSDRDQALDEAGATSSPTSTIFSAMSRSALEILAAAAGQIAALLRTNRGAGFSGSARTG
jgi:hypothetical protein